MSVIKKEVLQVFSKEEMDRATKAINDGDLAVIVTLDLDLVRYDIHELPFTVYAKVVNAPSRADAVYEKWRKSITPSRGARLKEILDTATIGSTNVTVGHGMSEDHVHIRAKNRYTWRSPLRSDGTIECSVEETIEPLKRDDYELLLTALMHCPYNKAFEEQQN